MLQARQDTPSSSRRLIASGMAVLVLLLGILSVNPTLHSWLHEGQSESSHQHGKTPATNTSSEAGCVVCQFAHGLISSSPVFMIFGPAWRWTAEIRLPDAALPDTPDRLHPPGRGPPSS